jgi:rod shape-determining protein MreD
VKAAGLVLATALAVAIQTAIGRFLGSGIGVDLILVVVVYAALSSGPMTGLITGTVAGLAQDAMSTGIIGVGGLAKTVVGFLAGVSGTQFIVAHPLPRFVAFFAASLLHAGLFFGTYAVLGVRDIGAPFGRLAAQGLGNAAIGLLVFKIAESLPWAEDSRMRR